MLHGLLAGSLRKARISVTRGEIRVESIEKGDKIRVESIEKGDEIRVESIEKGDEMKGQKH